MTPRGPGGLSLFEKEREKNTISLNPQSRRLFLIQLYPASYDCSIYYNMKSYSFYIFAIMVVSAYANQATSYFHDSCVMNYGDFERCTFGLCRDKEHEEQITAKKHSAVHTFKKARGGQIKKPVSKPAFHFDKDHKPPKILECTNIDHPCGFGMF